MRCGRKPMSFGHRFANNLRRALSAGIAISLCVACNDPKDPQTWIKRLRDPEHAAEAVRNLEKLGDPVAVEPLCKLFEDYPSAAILKAIISFNDRRAVPTLRKALDFTDPEQYNNSTRAARALAEMKVPEAVPDLIKVLDKSLPIKSRANLAKQAAIEALAMLGDKSAVPALIKVAQGEPDKQDFHLNKVAVVALGQLEDPRAVPVLIRSLFKSSRLQGSSFGQATVALVRIGPPAVAPLMRAMQGKNEDLNAYASEVTLREGEMLSKAASVLGDLRAEDAVGPMLAELAKSQGSASDVAGLEGVIIALGKIGDDRAVGPLLQLVQDAKADGRLRIKAARALTELGAQRAVPVLLELAEKGYLDGGLWDLRVDAVMAYSRIVGRGAIAGAKVIQAVLKDAKVRELAQYAPIRQVFVDALKRTELAIKCKADVDCYAKVLVDESAHPIAREKAAVMIGLLPNGRQALPAVVKALPTRNAELRQFLLETAKNIGKASDADLVKTLSDLADKDSRRLTKYVGADLARYDMVALAVIKRR